MKSIQSSSPPLFSYITELFNKACENANREFNELCQYLSTTFNSTLFEPESKKEKRRHVKRVCKVNLLIYWIVYTFSS
jgi:hypothetical protein